MCVRGEGVASGRWGCMWEVKVCVGGRVCVGGESVCWR